MAIKASAAVTLSSVVDVWSTTRYYLLQSSTQAAPAKPTTNPPTGGWNDTEPTYTSGSTNTLYFTDLTVFSDGSWAYSLVSVSSAYEAAKAAYNKAQAAQNAVSTLDTALNQQEIFNRLTDNGAAQGVVLYNGQLYVNASYINAGMLNVQRVNFNAPVDDFDIPDENDPDSLLDGQAVAGGWIVNASGSGSIVALQCRYAKLLRGRTITLTFAFNGSLNYCESQWDSLDGDGETNVTEPLVTPNPYTYTFVVPAGADSFELLFDCSGLKQIGAAVSGAQVVYPDDIQFTYAGLQVGDFLVDRSGNLFANARSVFGGGVKFTGSVAMQQPLPVASGGTGARTAAGALANLMTVEAVAIPGESASQINAYKCGRIAQLQDTGKTITAQARGWTTVFEVPAALRPTVTTHFAAVENSAQSQAASTAVNMRLTTAGLVQAYIFADKLTIAPRFTLHYFTA